MFDGYDKFGLFLLGFVLFGIPIMVLLLLVSWNFNPSVFSLVFLTFDLAISGFFWYIVIWNVRDERQAKRLKETEVK